VIGIEHMKAKAFFMHETGVLLGCSLSLEAKYIPHFRSNQSRYSTGVRLRSLA
jgi:hypothetical protein